MGNKMSELICGADIDGPKKYKMNYGMFFIVYVLSGFGFMYFMPPDETRAYIYEAF